MWIIKLTAFCISQTLSICSLIQCWFNVFIKSKHLLNTRQVPDPFKGSGYAKANETQILPSKISRFVGEREFIPHTWPQRRTEHGASLWREYQRIGSDLLGGKKKRGAFVGGKMYWWKRRSRQVVVERINLLYGRMKAAGDVGKFSLGTRKGASIGESLNGRNFLILNSTMQSFSREREHRREEGRKERKGGREEREKGRGEEGGGEDGRKKITSLRKYPTWMATSIP